MFAGILAAVKLDPLKYLIRFAIFVAIVTTVLTLGYCVRKEHDDANKNLVNQGAEQVQVQQQAETINAVQATQAVVRAPSSEQLNSVCSHYDRNCPR